MISQWRHNGRDGVSNHQPHDCLLNRLFRCRSKLRVTGLSVGNSPVTGEFPHKWPVTRKCFHLMTPSWNMCTVCDLLCLVAVKQRPIWGLYFRVPSPSLGISWWEIRQFSQSPWHNVDVHLVYLLGTVSTDWKKTRSNEKMCLFYRAACVPQLYANLAVSSLETLVLFQWIVSNWIWSVNINEFQ